MQRREREIRSFVAELGMEITSFRTDGGSHWRVDVKAPNGRQRPFTFPTREGDHRHKANERSMLRRWRREVMPELDAAEEAGTLQPPPPMRSQLADKLAKAGIPLKVEEQPKPGKLALHDIPPSQVSDVVLAASVVGDKKWEAVVASIPPREALQPGTPERALADTFSASAIPKEQPMSPQPIPINQTTPRTPHVQHKKREQMSFAEVMKFGSWMNKERLEGYYTRGDFLDHASHALGFTVSDDALRQWLESNGVEMPKRPQPVRPKGWQDFVSEDIAAIALALSDIAPGHREAMLAIVERRTKA